MAKKNVMYDLWSYLEHEEEDIKKAVLNQIPEEHKQICEVALSAYIHYIRYMEIGAIQKLNRTKDPYIKLINEELAKRSIFINSVYIHISLQSAEDYGEED